jgi:hypothetical protein
MSLSVTTILSTTSARPVWKLGGMEGSALRGSDLVILAILASGPQFAIGQMVIAKEQASYPWDRGK